MVPYCLIACLYGTVRYGRKPLNLGYKYKYFPDSVKDAATAGVDDRLHPRQTNQLAVLRPPAAPTLQADWPSPIVPNFIVDCSTHAY